MPDWDEILTRDGPTVWRTAYRIASSGGEFPPKPVDREAFQKQFLCSMSRERLWSVCSWGDRSYGRRPPRGVGFEGIEQGDGGLGVGHGLNGDSRGYERTRQRHLVVRRVAQPAESFKREADPLQVGIRRLDQFEPGEGVHLVTRRE